MTRRTLSGLAFAPWALAQANDPTAALEAWRSATLRRDALALEDLLHEELLFGHSNGRLESKAEFIRGIRTGNPVYENITLGNQTLVANDDMAMLRGEASITLLRDAARNTYKLNILHVFIREKRAWRLIGRQATRLAP